MIKTLNRWRSSLTVNGIRPGGLWRWRWSAVAVAREGVGEDREGDPAVPGGPATVLVLVEAESGLRGLERFRWCGCGGSVASDVCRARRWRAAERSIMDAHSSAAMPSGISLFE
jgi:hypothetical protein